VGNYASDDIIAREHVGLAIEDAADEGEGGIEDLLSQMTLTARPMHQPEAQRRDQKTFPPIPVVFHALIHTIHDDHSEEQLLSNS